MEEKTKHTLFAEIYAQESHTVFRFCVTRTSSRDQALDITQETFLRFWKVLVEGKRIEYVRPFLFKIARRLIIDWYRKKKSSSLEDLFEGDDFFESDLLTSQSIMDIEIASEGRYLLEAINKLPSTYRDAVYLRYVEGCSPQEIGDVLGVSANAASARISRGISELKRTTGYDRIQELQ